MGSKGKKSDAHSHGHGHRHGGTATLSCLSIKINGSIHDLSLRQPFSNVTSHPAGNAIRISSQGGNVKVSGRTLGADEYVDLVRGERANINGSACVVIQTH